MEESEETVGEFYSRLVAAGGELEENGFVFTAYEKRTR